MAQIYILSFLKCIILFIAKISKLLWKKMNIMTFKSLYGLPKMKYASLLLPKTLLP